MTTRRNQLYKAGNELARIRAKKLCLQDKLGDLYRGVRNSCETVRYGAYALKACEKPRNGIDKLGSTHKIVVVPLRQEGTNHI